MFVSVRYGDDDMVILNTDCEVQVFNNCLREKCNLVESKDLIDLADEFGTVQYISKRAPRVRVNSILETRLEYVLIQLKKEANGTVVDSLLNNWVPRTESQVEEVAPEPPRNVPRAYHKSTRVKR